MTHLKRPWCWERLKVGREGDNRGWDGWMVSPTQWTWVWASSGSWWWRGRPGVLQSVESQRVGHDWVTELNWTELDCSLPGSSVHGILQARILERVAILFSRGSYQPRDRTQVSCTAGVFFTIWASREAPYLTTGSPCSLCSSYTGSFVSIFPPTPGPLYMLFSFQVFSSLILLTLAYPSHLTSDDSQKSCHWPVCLGQLPSGYKLFWYQLYLLSNIITIWIFSVCLIHSM